MMKAMVVDDEILTAEHICRLLRNAGVEVLGSYSNPFEVLEKIELLKPNVLFLDIEMPEMSGLELAERIHTRGYECEIVFITAYNQYVIEAFSVNALDYLLKPVMAEGVFRAVERVNKRRMIGCSFKPSGGSNKIRVSLFGRFLVYAGDDKEPIHWMTAKCAEVFAFMLLQIKEKEVSKWKLMEAVWPEKDKEKSDINLRSTISRLNKTLRENALGISLVSTGNAYQLIYKDMDVEVDAFELERLILNSIHIDSGNADYYDSLISNYCGMLLEDIDSGWCDALRLSYHRYYISASKNLVKYYESVNTEPLKTLSIIERLIKFEPYDEVAREHAIRLHYRLGGRQSAEKYYREYKNLLGKELGTEPGVFLKRVFDDLDKL